MPTSTRWPTNSHKTGEKTSLYWSNGVEQLCSYQFLSWEREGLRIFVKGAKPLSSLMLNWGKGEVGCKGFLLHLCHRWALIFSSYQSTQISRDCSIPYASGTEKPPEASRGLAEHQQLTPNTLPEQTYTANSRGWHLPQNSSFQLLSHYATKGLFQSHSGYWDKKTSWESRQHIKTWISWL